MSKNVSGISSERSLGPWKVEAYVNDIQQERNACISVSALNGTYFEDAFFEYFIDVNAHFIVDTNIMSQSHTHYLSTMKGKAILAQARTGPEGSRRLRKYSWY
jgi:hypothetical protein